MKKQSPDTGAVIAEFSASMAPDPGDAIDFDAWEKMTAEQQRAFQQKSLAEYLAREAKAKRHVAAKFGLSANEVTQIVSPARISDPWFLHPISTQRIAMHAEAMLEADPARAGAASWRQARVYAQLVDRALTEGMADDAVSCAMTAMQHLIRAELLEGPLPMLKALKDRPRQAGKKAKDVPKPNRETALIKALKILVARKLSNPDIFKLLSDSDRVFALTQDEGFPIEVGDPKADVLRDGILEFYPSGKPHLKQQISVESIRKRISEIKNPRKQLSADTPSETSPIVNQHGGTR